ncbi:nuclear factor of activated T-cells, cytoplasmic 2 isoform X2 [Brachyhypopomus gauderio]|uniref:nuclear factor of activated T-cells, cytoplasmic 2 isoform X2 n=1 Tax=Brachyhypopomus gauderio TaxID=698409 RepID=UPI0040437591
MNSNYDNSDGGFAPGSGQDEMDLPFPLFLYSQPGSEIHDQDDLDAPSNSNPNSSCTTQGHVPYHDLSLSGLSYHHPPSEDFFGCPHPDLRDLLGHSFSSNSGPLAGASPRIEITCPDLHHHHRDHVPTAPVDISRGLAVPLYQNPTYRENLSPASSNSSTSWHSEVYSPQLSPQPSPCVSPSAGVLAAVTVAELCPMLQAIHPSGSPGTSPTNSPRTSVTEETLVSCRPPSSPRPGSRSASPQGKRTYDQYQNPGLVGPRSRSPSPHARREEQPVPYEPTAHLEEFINKGLIKTIPTKIVRPSQEYSIYGLTEQVGFTTVQDVKQETVMEPLYFTPSIEWPSQMPPGMCSVSVASPPSLDWTLPSSAKQYELSIEVQPRPHHRAHYETEGSRGPVKAASGGHPVVQLRGYSGREVLALQVFIGTADERAVRPHAFYQVHRITGKTVTTSSRERIVNGTKVLELPLEPKDGMRAIVDCAGILKLKNADIELRKGETDVGRKNTRVRLVFRVHVPRPGGQWLSLQAASQPIECSQRSALELPAVERQDLDCCSVLGGVRMILTGQNFSSESRVLFTEKTQDGLEVWEAEARVDREKSQANMLYLDVPPYRDASIYHPAKVNFYVLNGKRKRSQPQHFTYTPLSGLPVKVEPVDDYHYGQRGGTVPQVLGMSPQSCCHGASLQASSCAMPGVGVANSQRNSTLAYPPVMEYQHQHPSGLYQSHVEALGSSPGHYQPSLDHPDPRGHGSPSSHMGLNPASHLKPGGYQHAVAEHSYKASASVFPGIEVSEHSPVMAQQREFSLRASPVARRSPPGKSYAPQQFGPPVEHQRTGSPARVTVKQENLDQAYLDDVNEVIRKDLIVHNTEQ